MTKRQTAALHRLTLICEDDEWRGLVADLRRQDSGDLVSDIRKRIRGQARYVELITSDVATMSALVQQRAPNATCRVAKARSAKLPAQRAGKPRPRQGSQAGSGVTVGDTAPRSAAS